MLTRTRRQAVVSKYLSGEMFAPLNSLLVIPMFRPMKQNFQVASRGLPCIFIQIFWIFVHEIS